MKIKSFKDFQDRKIATTQTKFIKGGSDDTVAIEKLEIAIEKLEVVL
ncbi:MAG: hypothetical protein AB8G15_16135 [Saprospiraceae bacterium]